MGLFKKRIKESASDVFLVRNRRSAITGLGELGNSALWACVMQLSKLYATLPWSAYSKDSSYSPARSTVTEVSILVVGRR